MTSNACPNCSTYLSEWQRFCAHCGQKNNFHRFTVGHVSHEFFHAFTHADSGILVLIKELAKNPGRVASEYVGGKVKKYFSPFTFLLLCVGLFVLINNVLKTYPDPPKPDAKVLAILPTAEARKNYTTLIERTASASTAVGKHANVLTLIAMPLYTFIMWIFFRNRKRNFAEIMIAMIFFTAFSSLAVTILLNPIMAYYKGTPKYFYVFLVGAVLQSFYYTWGFKHFFNYRSATAYLKIWPAMILIYIIWMVITMLGFFFYIYRDKTWTVLEALLNQLF